jgi:hypothetical protein
MDEGAQGKKIEEEDDLIFQSASLSFKLTLSETNG